MAGLKLKFGVCQEACDTLLFNETTGIYSEDNDGGWNDASTEMVGDANSATLTITYPDGTVSSAIDLSSLFPSTDEDVQLEIAAEDVGVTGDFVDGVYTFRYDVVMEDATEYYKTCTIFLSCQAECCVDKLWAKVTTTDCRDCSNSKLKFAAEAEGFLKAAQANARCGNASQATALLAKVQYMCNLERCNC